MPLRLVAFFSFLILLACNKGPSLHHIDLLTKNLEVSNLLLAEKNEKTLDEFHVKLKDVHWSQKLKYWYPKADSFTRLTKVLLVELDALIKLLRSLQEGDQAEARKIISENGPVLFEKLTTWVNTSWEILDTAIYSDYSYASRKLQEDKNKGQRATMEMLGFLPDSLLKITLTREQWLHQYFDNTSTLLSIAMLTKFKNDIIQANIWFVDLCFLHSSPGCVLEYYVTKALVSISAEYVKRGQAIEIVAGIGEFSVAGKPTFRINGEKIKPGDDATASYKFVATGKPGKHSIPVDIVFVKPDGSLGTINKLVEYIIAE